MLDLRNVSKYFSGIAAVEHVSFTARAGEVTGYLAEWFREIDHDEDDQGPD